MSDTGEQDEQEYSVVWEVDLTARDCVDAALQALIMHRDADSIATVFTVHRDRDVVQVDLGGDAPVNPHWYHDPQRPTITPYRGPSKVREAALDAMRAAAGDSNDREIEALTDALELALQHLGIRLHDLRDEVETTDG